jgi:hypothetical protein
LGLNKNGLLYPSQNITQEKGRQGESSKRIIPTGKTLKRKNPRKGIPCLLQMHMLKRDTTLVTQVYGKLF